MRLPLLHRRHIGAEHYSSSRSSSHARSPLMSTCCIAIGHCRVLGDGRSNMLLRCPCIIVLPSVLPRPPVSAFLAVRPIPTHSHCHLNSSLVDPPAYPYRPSASGKYTLIAAHVLTMWHPVQRTNGYRRGGTTLLVSPRREASGRRSWDNVLTSA